MELVTKTMRPDDPRWDELVDDVGGSTIYHSTRWLVPICEAAGDELTILGCFRGEELMGGIALQTRQRGPFSLCRRAYATPYAGLLARDDGEEREHVHDAVTGFLERQYSQACITSSPFSSPLALEQRGWRRVMRHTYLHDITDANRFWTGVASEVRNRIRKAEKAGADVIVDADARPFYQLYDRLFRGMGKEIPIGEQSFVALIEAITRTGVAKTYLATTHDGDPAAACLILVDKNRAYYSLAASNDKLRKTGAASLLIWHVVQDLCEVVPEFDFGGANVANVAQFKSKFRGQLVEYYEFTHYRSAFERAAFLARDHLLP